ncbi:PREDICTED: uncharacterized protein LOC108764680 [Trachymyrmex cornetzi]|uniref:uncharacterized protein LOC108764680 n=1 Tax=Trachymyrmex cornetzi TaxID=471704 RepID=UPI00084F0F31|nr:PREDICTED: uncharacterized protein LOC108764680 [Trachymyrmex cornetzi]
MPDSDGSGSNEQASNAAALKSLKSKRAQIKRQCTRVATYLETSGVQSASPVELRQRLHKVNETWDAFNDVQSAIEEIEITSDNTDSHDEERRAFEEKYFAIASGLEALIEARLGLGSIVNLNQNSRREREGTPATLGGSNSDHLKLPRVNLPTFAGTFEEWMPFRNMFRSMIDQNAALPKAQKMQYLVSALRGEARDIIGSLEISDENYTEAWEMLLDRYDDSGAIIQKHIKAMFEIQAVAKENHLSLRRLLDCFLKHLRALKALNRPIDSWDDLMVYLISSRLDPKTNRAWEITVKQGEAPTLKQLTDFLAQHCKALEASARTTQSGTPGQNLGKGHQAKGIIAAPATISSKCTYCRKEGHPIYKCPEYLQMSVNDRFKEARTRKLCLNCLKVASHIAKNCSGGACRRCNKRHNTLLHMESSSEATSEAMAKEVTTEQEKVVAIGLSHKAVKQENQILLATALVNIADNNGRSITCRVLLDSGSQSCFITSSCVKRLAVKPVSTNVPISGLGAMSTQANKRVRITLQSRVNKFSTVLDCLVIERITQAIPGSRISMNELQVPEGILLADPEFYKSSVVDLLLGAEIFFDLMCVGRIKISRTQPTWQKTLLGWIASGSLTSEDPRDKGVVCNLAVYEELNANLARFWQIEHQGRQSTRSPEERICEKHFERTYQRNKEGRFIVRLPVKEEQLQKIGDSQESALRRFNNLEKKFSKQPQLKQAYVEFMQEYLQLGHMREVQTEEADVQPQYYLAHHCVLKESSTTTRLRVVFDASSKSSSGVSLNDALMVGPVVQQDLFAILLRFRSFKYVVTSDISKMYRQIFVHPEQTSLQRIIWRDNPEKAIKKYELLTLTYGTAPASFLATKSIQQLANLEEKQWPVGAAVARRDFYMDDLISGADSIGEAKMIRDQVAALLLKGGFVLRKWASNDEELLRDVPGERIDNAIMELDKDGTTKTLGVKWNHRKDAFQYSIKVACTAGCTKRIMLASIAQIFDPLGLLAPAIITAKILIQELWRLQLEWDESLPADIFAKWSKFTEDMQCLDEFCVPRRVVAEGSCSEVQLHGFCDASERAYGACIYLKTLNQDGSAQVQLLCAKSRVAPIKTVSIPRLELCGAQLLVQLVNKVRDALVIKLSKTYYWSDSSIVLQWIKCTNKRLPVFVAHRVGEIQESTAAADWNHVGSKENPADLVSRGTAPRELCNAQLWWEGPTWLKDMAQVRPWRQEKDTLGDPVEQDSESIVALTSKIAPDDSFMNRFSTLQRLIRVTATCLRFANFCRKKREKTDKPLSAEELAQAKLCLIKMEQNSAFHSEIEALRKGRAIANSSCLKYLNPLLDKDDLLRVGGRLRHADLQYDAKHQLVLPQRSRITELIIMHEHIRHFHAGAQATLAAVRQSYWPIRARGTIKRLIYKCVKCFRYRPRHSTQIMGDLPRDRVSVSRPFVNVGVDFCGPIHIRERRGRGSKRVKGYVAVFVCMAVKAIHLEVVSDLTTEAFLNAFKRFIGRRGKPTNVYSDNGTNFVGADKELKKCLEVFSQEQKGRNIMDYAASEGIKWNFIPARAPHFGGLWESSVKSFKAHFYKTASDACLTFEEVSTLVVQIEGILNSRPLTAISEDPNDLGFLSPGHFLIGAALTSFPEADLLDTRINRLSRWQLIERIRQHFWKRWSAEYLLGLQRRNKWPSNTGPTIQVGQLVVCREDGLPPLKWVLGRVYEVMPGADGVVRAAKIKTVNGEYKRPAAKLCVLPIEEGPI